MSDDASLPVGRRRRWPRIVGLVLLLALISGGVYWLVRPPTVTATALFEVRVDPPSILVEQEIGPNWQVRYDILKNTQIALLRSKFLMAAVLRNPNVASLPILAGVADPEQWLTKHLDVTFPENGAVLAISLSGPASQANDLSRIVDAIAATYKRQVIDNEKAHRLSIHDMLERSLQNIQVEIKHKSEDYLDIAKSMGKSSSDNDTQLQLNMKRMDRIEDEIAQLERDTAKMQAEGDSKNEKFVTTRREALLKKRYDLEQVINKRSERSPDLESRGEELKQLQEIANDMNLKLEKMDIEAQSPSQIEQVQSALIEPQRLATR